MLVSNKTDLLCSTIFIASTMLHHLFRNIPLHAGGESASAEHQQHRQQQQQQRHQQQHVQPSHPATKPIPDTQSQTTSLMLDSQHPPEKNNDAPVTNPTTPAAPSAAPRTAATSQQSYSTMVTEVFIRQVMRQNNYSCATLVKAMYILVRRLDLILQVVASHPSSNASVTGGIRAGHGRDRVSNPFEDASTGPNDLRHRALLTALTIASADGKGISPLSSWSSWSLSSATSSLPLPQLSSSPSSAPPPAGAAVAPTAVGAQDQKAFADFRASVMNKSVQVAAARQRQRLQALISDCSAGAAAAGAGAGAVAGAAVGGGCARQASAGAAAAELAIHGRADMDVDFTDVAAVGRPERAAPLRGVKRGRETSSRSGAFASMAGGSRVDGDPFAKARRI